MCDCESWERKPKALSFLIDLWVIECLCVEMCYYFLLLFLVGWDSPLGTAATTALLYQPQMIDEGDCGAVGGMKIGRGNRSTRKKPCPNATLSTSNPTWPEPDSSPDRRGEFYVSCERWSGSEKIGRGLFEGI
jgi:hypothetical protein